MGAEQMRKLRAARKAAGGLPEGDRRHGTVAGYSNWGCRCKACSRAVKLADVSTHKAPEYIREMKRAERERKKQSGLPEGDSRHGTANGYENWMCRCAPCTEAKRLKDLTRPGRNTAYGAKRREMRLEREAR